MDWKQLQGRDSTRERVRRRDNYTCQDCGKVWELGKRRFDCHHINDLCGKLSRKYDRRSDMENMITLCHKCHFNRPEHRVQQVDFGGRRLKKIFRKDYPIIKKLRQTRTLKEIGNKYGVSKQRIHQILTNPHLIP